MKPFFQRSIQSFRSITVDGVRYVHSAKLSCGHTHTYQRRQLWPSKRTTAPCRECGSGRRYLRKSEVSISCVVPGRLTHSRQVEQTEAEILRRIAQARPSTQYARQVEPRDVTWQPRAISAAMLGTPTQREALVAIVLLAIEQAHEAPRTVEQEARNERTIREAQIAGILDRPHIDAKDRA